jgi:hypothetical protein
VRLNVWLDLCVQAGRVTNVKVRMWLAASSISDSLARRRETLNLFCGIAGAASRLEMGVPGLRSGVVGG